MIIGMKRLVSRFFSMCFDDESRVVYPTRVQLLCHVSHQVIIAISDSVVTDTYIVLLNTYEIQFLVMPLR